MATKRKLIAEVFTPRSAHVNSGMYIRRDILEKALVRSVNGSMHSFLFGVSGSGKTWMFKSVFDREGIKYVVANCARANLSGSLGLEIQSACNALPVAEKIAYSETKKASASALVGAEIAHEGSYEFAKPDRLLKAFQKLNGGISISRKKPAVVVIENVEALLKNQALLEELGNLIILLDDERYSGYRVKFLIVGVPDNVIEYFSSTDNPTSVGNRIDEIPRISGLSHLQVISLLDIGFKQNLKVNFTSDQFERLCLHVFNVTLGIPQRIHEYCECLAYLIEESNWEYVHQLLDGADRRWLVKGLRKSYTAINSHLNSDETSTGRRNQVIYAIGRISNHQIDTNQIGDVIASEFPNNTPESRSGIGQILSHLCTGESPILKKIDNSTFYAITDPRILMCIRLALYKDEETGSVKKLKFEMN